MANAFVVSDHHERFLLPLLLVGGTAAGVEPSLLEAIGLSTFPANLKTNTEMSKAGQQSF